jgi:Protein of unknown function (DUF4038)/Putative collagen-binding domain of a collagenase
MKLFRIAVLLFPFAGFHQAQGAVEGPLQVAPGGRYLQYKSGKPFFYLGDTAWELFHKLNREEATQYLANRAAKGFTVVQAAVLGQLGGLTVSNAYGDLPLADRNPAKPNEAYFRHVDFIINKAEELGLYVGMVPTWGTYWSPESQIFSAATARQYGEFLGKRYKDKPIIWILGGDRTISTPAERALIDAMAAGVAAGDGGAHLKTYHPSGPGQSSVELHSASWLDFNMYQSSHGARDHDNGLYAEHDWALTPTKPTMDGEPRYENLPIAFYQVGVGLIDRFDDYDARQAAYWSVLAGACGHTYGNNSVWQMYKPDPEALAQWPKTGAPWGLYVSPGGGSIGANIPWQAALDHPGAFQMGHLRRLMESLPFTKLVPDQKIILNGPTTGGAKLRAARASDGSFALVYSPRGEPFTLDKRVVKAARQRQAWFDPRYGVVYVNQEPDGQGIQTYTPPTSGRGADWVLIIVDAAAGYVLPGER